MKIQYDGSFMGMGKKKTMIKNQELRAPLDHLPQIIRFDSFDCIETIERDGDFFLPAD